MSQPRTTEILESTLSDSKTGFKTGSFLDDYIVQGKVFVIGLAQAFTASTPILFTSEFTTPSIDETFLLPISINPTSGYVTMTIYEGTNYTGGTAVLPYNRNRTSDNTNEISIKVGATGTTKGTTLFTRVYGTTATGGFFGGSSGGGGGSSSNAFILDLTKKYLYELTASETALVGIEAEFAEI